MSKAIAILLLMASINVQAASQKQEKDLETNMSFEDMIVKGKYHFSDEAVSTVEEDKVLDSLLGIRKDFKDRIERSANRF